MKFIDECKIEIHAGKGGNGVVAFRREAHVSRGGPDGGDGGNGGSIFLRGEPGMNTLINLKLKRIVRGNNGDNGRAKNQYGAYGKDVYIKVPLGTLVYNEKRLICDVVEQKDYLIAKGGIGGKGNTKFKSSKNQAPMLSENGTKGEQFEARLELKVLADVGFVGKPSAGKSTLLSKVSNAKPKIADYAFTTLTPQLGLVSTNGKSFVAADLPGLIEGAAQGKGLGHEFLKHIERCRVIAHIIDFGDEDKDPIKDYLQINAELKEYELKLEDKKQVVIANKKDLEPFKDNLKKFKAKFKDVEVVEISAIEEDGIELMKAKLYDAYINSEEITYETEDTEVTITLEESVIVDNPIKGEYDVSGAAVERIYDKIPLTTTDNYRRFHRLMRDVGVWSELEKKNVKHGDTVRIFGYEFDWEGEEEE